MIRLCDVFTTQRGLRWPAAVPQIIAAINGGRSVQPIELIATADGACLIHDGHHRAVAYWLAGCPVLVDGEYILVEGRWLPRAELGRRRDRVPTFADRFRTVVAVTGPAGARRL